MNDVSNQATLKDHNVRKILRFLLHNGPTGRKELSKIVGVVPSTVTSLARELLADGVIEEIPSTDTQRVGAGRPPILLNLLNERYVALGADIGVGFIRLGLVGLLGRVTSQEFHSFTLDTKETELFQLVLDYYDKMKELCQKDQSTLVGLGVSLPGSIQADTGVCHFSPNLGWRNLAVGDFFWKRIQEPVIVDNNVNLMALGENFFGKGNNAASLIFVHLGPGLGCGIVLADLGILRGSRNGAGELGHCTILPNGPQCSCGKRGCLEALVSEASLIRTYNHLSKQKTPVNTGDQLLERAQSGDVDAVSVIREACEFLGNGIATLINLFEPEHIVLSGNSLMTSEETQRWISHSLQAHVFTRDLNVTFSNSSFKEQQGVIGAASAVLKQEVFKD